jgi:hypothetical protein
LHAQGVDFSLWRDRFVLQEAHLIVAAGNRTEAERLFRAGLAIRERLAAAGPANVGFQRDLSVSSERLGDLALDGGDHDEAVARYEASLGISAARRAGAGGGRLPLGPAGPAGPARCLVAERDPEHRCRQHGRGRGDGVRGEAAP